MKILVVDDHALIREALRGVLRDSRPDTEVFEAAGWREALGRIEADSGFGLVLLDLGLPDCKGLDALEQLWERHPQIPVVVLSATDDAQTVARALEMGAAGFIPKSASRDVMLGALNLVFAGGVYIPPAILASQPPSAKASSPDIRLTERQRAVLALMMQGRSNKAICRALDLAEPTVKNHVTQVLRALNASNRTEAVIAARKLGIES